MTAPPSSKWISGLTGDMPVVDAARRVLDVRLEAVLYHLGTALEAPYEDSEHVHQLRVSTRRAVAALDLFALCLPSKAYRSSRKFLRDIRRAAGAARDWDVFLAQLPIELPKRSARRQPGLDFLTGFALGQRLIAQEELQEASSEYPEDVEQVVKETLTALQKPRAGPRTLVELGRADLLAILQELDQATTQELHDYSHLHRVRIIGKRLRYAMEIFVDCYPPDFKDTLYPVVEEMQDILGRANDSFVAGQRLRQLTADLRAVCPAQWKRFKPALDHLIRFHAKRLPEERGRFEGWWGQWQEKRTTAAFAALLQSTETRDGSG